MPALKKNIPSRNRYYKKTFKITKTQNQKLKLYCKKHKTSEKKVLRKAMQEYLSRHIQDYELIHVEISDNQLSLFN